MCCGAIFFSTKAVADTFLVHDADGRERTLLHWAVHLQHGSMSNVCLAIAFPLKGAHPAHEGIHVLQVASWSEIKL